MHPHIHTDPPHSLIPTAATPTVATSIATSTAFGLSSPPSKPNMIFSDIYKSPRSPIAKIRRQSVQFTSPYSSTTPDWVAEEYADLLSKDKTKQKEAVKRYLDDKVKTDWEFQWPSRAADTPETKPEATLEKETPVEDSTQKPAPENDVAQVPVVGSTETVEPVQDKTHEDPGYQGDSDAESEAGNDDEDDTKSVYSTVSEDPVHYKARLEWASDFSDDDEGPPTFRSPFRFDSPETVGPAVQEGIVAKRAKRRRAVRDEMKWNEGLACFEARRNAWTGARTVRVRPKPVSPPAVSPRSPRRFFFRRSMSSSPPTSTHMPQGSQGGDSSDGSSIAKGEEKELRKQSTKDTVPLTPPDTSNYMVETLVPIGQPLLPPNNPLRASITPSVYINLYEKVILHNLQPSCPINLTDMLRSCVAGWKRDGEWPPRGTPAPPMVARKKKKVPKPETVQKERSGSIARRMSLGLLGRDKDEEAGTGKGIRKSIQRVLGIGANETTAPSNTPVTTRP